MQGKPVIVGTRVTVEQIVRECARGLSIVEVARQYPRPLSGACGARLGRLTLNLAPAPRSQRLQLQCHMAWRTCGAGLPFGANFLFC
jgi:hypothetical protein